jgi:hypothetical protein
MRDPRGGPIVCHADICPENVVFRDGEALALRSHRAHEDLRDQGGEAGTARLNEWLVANRDELQAALSAR